MTDQNVPRCAQCGKCCREMGAELPMLREDHLLWVKQQRQDILQHAEIPDLSDGWGELWIDPDSGDVLNKCPFLNNNEGNWSCAIEDTKPRVCKEFWCEFAYGVGEKGMKFKSLKG
jgi:Fe-S-cluster containining protein